jgi:hypothetical protein
MSVPDQLHVEMNLGNAILDMTEDPILDMTGDPILDLGWIDVKDDVLTETPITIVQGQRNGDPLDRVGDAGTIKLVMNNNDSNTAGAVGYYSPDHQAKRGAFGNGTRVRVGITKSLVQEWLAEGRIISVDPEPGLLSNKTVMVTVADWLEVASRSPMPRIPVQENVTDDQVLQLIVDAVDDPPVETDFATGAYTYEYAPTDVEEDTKVMSVLQTIVQCGLGRLYITGGPTSGEVLKYVDLFSLLSASGSSVASFVDDQLDMSASRKAYKRVKRVVVTYYPHEKDASPVVLFSLTNEILIPSGQSVRFVGYYRDPNANSSKSIAAVNVVTPVIGTDLQLSTVAGSGSGNLNGSLSITSFKEGGRAAEIELKNNSGSNGYLQAQFRGEGLYPYDAVTYTAENASIKDGEGVTLNYDLRYHSDYFVAKEIADNLLAWYEVEITDVPSLDFVPTLDDDSFDKLLVCKPGELINVSESVTGVGYAMVVLGREISIWNGGKYITERLFITPAQQTENGLFMQLDIDGQSELDGDNTILAFG